MRNKFILGILTIFLWSTCTSDQSMDNNSSSLFELLSSEQTGVYFTNEVKDEEEFNILTYRNYYNGAGVALGDVNNDGLVDIYFTANLKPNQLFLNKGDWKFEDVTQSAGVAGTKKWSTGVSMVDINHDGFLDIYVCNSGDIGGENKENELFINQQDGTFIEQATSYGLADQGFSTHAAFFDFDGDGDLDCYLLNNSYKNPERLEMYGKIRDDRDALGGDKLYLNENGKFSDISEKAGIYGSEIGFGLGISVSDYNGDYYPDIYISNDFWERDYLYINQKDGTYKEDLMNRISYTSVSSMGSDAGDLNNDGWTEIFSTDMLPADNYRLKAATKFDETYVNEIRLRSSFYFQYLQNCLQMNQGEGNFVEAANLNNVAATDWSWGALIFDFENDGWKDIFVCNGVYHDIMNLDFIEFIGDKEEVAKVVKEKGEYDFRDFLQFLPSTKLANYAFSNQKGKTFSNDAEALGLGGETFSNGAAYGDLDNDGDLDLVINNVNMPGYVYRNKANETKKNNYLRFQFSGMEKNTFGVGCMAKIYSSKGIQVSELYPNRGYESSVEPVLHFGLGDEAKVDSVLVIWPDRSWQKISNPTVNQVVKIEYKDAQSSSTLPTKKINTTKNSLFASAEDLFVTKPLHKENRYNDFNHERLLPHMLSTEGPKIIKGAIDKNGLDDFILLGAAGDEDKVFLQQKDGSFIRSVQPNLSADKDSESVCGELFDADGDNDMDLIIGVGGNEYGKGFENFYVRYYKNDGKGNFSREVITAPIAGGHISCIRSADFDSDGDLDLFLGGRTVPGNYGLNPRSFVLKNSPTGWTDVTNQFSGDLGMVTDAQWLDFDRDGDLDLAVVGEWEPITFLKNEKGDFTDKLQLPNSEGWWNCLEVKDLDGDKDPDLVLGNWGLNSKLRASAQKPLELYVKDFDGNKKTEFILNWYPPLDDKAYPFPSKSDLTAQLPYLKKRILKYDAYANLDYEGLFTEEERKGAIFKQTKELRNSILINGETGWRLEPLPQDAQIAPIYAIEIEDINNDKLPDLILGGNFHGLKPELGRQDSGRGLVLLQKEDNTFQPMDSNKSGINLKGEIRDITIIKNTPNREKIFLFGKNDAALSAFRLNEK